MLPSSLPLLSLSTPLSLLDLDDRRGDASRMTEINLSELVG